MLDLPESTSRSQELQVEIQLTREASAPEDVVRQLEDRLRAVPYVLSATWSAEVVEDDRDRLLRGTVVLAQLEQLPDEEPDLGRYLEAFRIPGVLGPNGPLPQTARQQAEFAIDEIDRRDQDRRLRAAVRRWEEEQHQFRSDHPELAGSQLPQLGPTMAELSVVLNGLCEEIDLASVRACRGSTAEGRDYDFDQAYAAGLRAAGMILFNEISRRGLPFLAEEALGSSADMPPD